MMSPIFLAHSSVIGSRPSICVFCQHQDLAAQAQLQWGAEVHALRLQDAPEIVLEPITALSEVIAVGAATLSELKLM